jgi:hypothetical protein
MRNRIVIFLLSLLTIVICSGCAAKITGLKKDKSFVYSAVLGGKMVIGGVASLTNPFNEQDRTRYANLLRSAIIEERKEFSVSPVSLVVNKLGKEDYHALLDSYRDTGGLSNEQLSMLKTKVTGVKYFVFARVEADDISKNVNTTEGGKHVEKKVSRAMAVAFEVYDIADAKVVWSGLISTTLSGSNSYENTKESVLIDFVKSVSGKSQTDDEKHPYPATPSMKKVFDKIFKEFGDAMPEE